MNVELHNVLLGILALVGLGFFTGALTMFAMMRDPSIGVWGFHRRGGFETRPYTPAPLRHDTPVMKGR